MLLGCIADDLTGASDLALTLTRQGMRTLQVMKFPDDTIELDRFDAVVVALKTRTCPAEEAVTRSLAAADALLAAGAKQFFFKYCSTFDSTDDGNIGPVADALMRRLHVPLALVCPAFPTNKRTIYMGNLYVADQLLSESAMKDHPLTPMRDSNLMRVLARQTSHNIGLIPFDVVDQGHEAIAGAIASAQQRGDRYVVIDAITDRDLFAIGTAAAGMALITGGSGVALGLPANFVRQGLLKPNRAVKTWAAPPGRAAILAGSCSVATRGQVKAAIDAGSPTFEVDPMAIASGVVTPDKLVAWAVSQDAARPVLIFSSANPDAVARAQIALGRAEAGEIVERLLASTARELTSQGFSRLIVAGGETSGAVITGLSIPALEIGPEIDPGVPWTRASSGGPDLVLALKSGNFGAPDFFLKAWAHLS